MQKQQKAASRLSFKLFIGCLCNAEIRLNLYNIKIEKLGPLPFQEVRFRGKNYLGCYLPDENIGLEALRVLEQEIQNKFHLLCPALEQEHLPTYLFSQLFIS